jgi:hypothetical protein
MLRICALAAGIFVAGAVTAQAQQAPGMTTLWIAINNADKQRCLQAAGQAVLDAGFGRNHETVGNTVFGERGRYTAAARCVADKNMLFIAVAGPDSNDTSRFATEIQTQAQTALK